MPITINGSGTLTGVSTGGLPNGIVDEDMIATNAVSTSKLATNTQSGIAKAWVNFNGTTNTSGTCTMRDSFNVNSVTDNGTGDYTVNFLSGALANGNYCMTGGISWYSGNSRNILSVASIDSSNNTVAPTTTALRLESVNYGNGTKYDAEYVCIAVFGD